MNISGAKFEEHCFYISRDILSLFLYSVYPHIPLHWKVCLHQVSWDFVENLIYTSSNEISWHSLQVLQLEDKTYM